MRVVVIGAGIVGAACARELARAGCEVVLLDRGGAAAATTSHGEGNILISDKEPGPELALAQLSRALWPQVLAEPGTRPIATGRAVGTAVADRARTEAAEWDTKGGIVVATTAAGATALRAFAAAQRAAGVTATELSDDALHAAEPHLTRDHTAAVHYPQDAQVQPAGAATLLLGDAVAAGAQLRTGCAVTGPVRSGGRLTAVRTEGGTVAGDAFVNATGPWAGAVSASLGAPIDVRPRRGEVLVTTPQPPTVFHKVYDADYVGAVASDEAAVQTSAVVESTRGGTVLLGSSRRQVGFADAMPVAVWSAIAAKALRLFPGLSGVPVMRAYGGFRPFVPDHLPVIGADERLPGLWHATGHEGAGIGLSVGTGRILANLIGGRTPPIDPVPFSPNRSAVAIGER
ncbi:NAD(P)/FAD-dependent oxidoreductase [Actinocatenispora comari]|uniref:FAD-dependent oxidoreductase n=1 Tax=Actinocatenispora comari TaxID=2807577 RepID=A0A8J4A546_9ACTN|nr:FAD-dependent oxidoreductase [Actinocatenispora comari]GIL25169.1 FAD-dependent oxidoreductase [Actinocatenispora comari]